MWAPIDKDALPSPQEVQHAKEMIYQLESMLRDAVDIERDNLEKEIEARRAWLAPIRKLPVEILSEIFVICSQICHLMPVTITEVSHSWRKIILSTLQAWSVIDHECPLGSNGIFKYTSTFIERSDPYNLHFQALDEHETRNYHDYDCQLSSVIPLVVKRLQCLCFISSSLFLLIDTSVFPNLTTLSLRGIPNDIKTSFFNRSRSPCLQYLDSAFCIWVTSATENGLDLPYLRYLVIFGDTGTTWIEVIRACCATLEGLEAITPVLLLYKDTRDGRTTSDVLHYDIKNVTRLQTNHIHRLNTYISLRYLHIAASFETMESLAEKLKLEDGLLPFLQSIEYYAENGRSVALPPKIENTIKNARTPQISLCYPDHWNNISDRLVKKCEHTVFSGWLENIPLISEVVS